MAIGKNMPSTGDSVPMKVLAVSRSLHTVPLIKADVTDSPRWQGLVRKLHLSATGLFYPVVVILHVSFWNICHDVEGSFPNPSFRDLLADTGKQAGIMQIPRSSIDS